MKKKTSKKKEFVLTPKTYWDPDRPHISNSMVSDYLKSPWYYFEKHVARSRKVKSSVPMRIGKTVDSLITGESLPYGLKTEKGQDPDTYMTEDQLKTACDIGDAIMKQPFFKEYVLKKAEFQKVVEAEVEGVKVCGLLDIYSADSPGKIFVDDVKTAAQYATKNAGQWFFHALDFGYLRQFAAYRYMVHAQTGCPKEAIICRHIVASKIEDGVIRVRLFIIHARLLDRAEKEWKEAVLAISKLRRDHPEDWADKPIEWADAEELKAPNGLKEEEVEFDDL